jgi:hypothetical protein
MLFALIVAAKDMGHGTLFIAIPINMRGPVKTNSGDEITKLGIIVV